MAAHKAGLEPRYQRLPNDPHSGRRTQVQPELDIEKARRVAKEYLDRWQAAVLAQPTKR